MFRLDAWCRANGVQLNITKCDALCFSKRWKYIHFTYTLRGRSLSKISSIRNLVVNMYSSLSFVYHIDEDMSKAFWMLGFIKRLISNFSSIPTIRLFYSSLIGACFFCLEFSVCLASNSAGINKIHSLFGIQIKYPTYQSIKDFALYCKLHFLYFHENMKRVNKS